MLHVRALLPQEERYPDESLDRFAESQNADNQPEREQCGTRLLRRHVQSEDIERRHLGRVAKLGSSVCTRDAQSASQNQHDYQNGACANLGHLDNLPRVARWLSHNCEISGRAD